MPALLRLIAVVLFFFLSPGRSASQEKPPGKLTFEGYVLSDSLEYNAGSIDYYFDDRKIVMNENATIRFLGRTVKSPVLNYYEKFDYMEAVGKTDSTGTYIETPVFIDTGGEELRGLEIKYNTRTQEGFIKQGVTKYDTGYYHSDIIKRVAEDTLYVANGSFTTCDKEHPHFYFAGNRMKFIVKDKIIIKPITAYVYDIPVMWFPFYVYPIAKGRQSGFLTPRYGSSLRDGRYVSNLGYYFAPSDYWDFRTAGVFREKNGWLIKNWFDYTGKQDMSGSLFGSYEDRTDEGTKEWELQFSHRHTISPTLSITGSGNFQSSDYSRYNSTNLYERLNRDLRSSLSIAKKWKESGNSLTTTITNEKNLDTKDTKLMLPSMRFRTPRKALFGDNTKKLKRRKYVKDTAGEDHVPAWYENIYYSFNADFSNADNKTSSARLPGETNEEFSRDMSMASSLSGSFKFMNWLATEPSLNLSESFTASNRYAAEERYRRSDNLSMSLGLGTTVYGTFAPSIGRLVGIRHVLTPSISYSYGKNRAYYADDPEAFLRFDKNDLGKSKRNSMNLNLRNLIQVKTIHESKENKFDLLTLNFSTSVDYEKEKRKLSPLITTLDFTPFKRFLTTRLTASHDFYHDDDSFHFFSPYMTNASITTDVGLTGTSTAFLSRSSREYANTNLGRDDIELGSDVTTEEQERSGGSSSMPVNLTFSHTYQLTRIKTTTPGKYSYRATHTIKPTISFSPTTNFSINYSLYYDIEKKSLNFHRLIITRELHCWEANISWVPSGMNEGYYFLVNIKDLPDIKIEKRRGTTRQSY